MKSLLSLALVSLLALGACYNSTGPSGSAANEPGLEQATGDLAKPGTRGRGRNMDGPQRGRAGDPIATLATKAGFSELVGALAYVDDELGMGLVDLFANGRDQYTVFAPDNMAFDNLYGLLSVVLETSIDEISDIPAPVVRDVLLYHVTQGRRASNSVVPPVNNRTIESLLGESFDVRTDGTIEDGLTGLRDDATIVMPDNFASNGVVHGINQVIVPPSVVAALTGN